MASGRLVVELVDARKLKDTRLFCKIKPYVLIRYENQERRSSTGKGRNPEWNDKFSFPAEYTEGSKNQHKITLGIMDKDSFCMADRFLGESVIYVKDVLSFGAEKGRAELAPRKYRVVLANKNYHGEIRVGVTFTREIEDKSTEDIGGWKQSSLS